MKKILFSIMTLGIVAVVAVYATQAYFSDTETSSGNTFTAGKLDLIFKDIDGDQNPDISGPLFTLVDMKPGDTGEKTVQLYVDNNPACGFVDVNLTSDMENSCSEPEIIAEPECEVPGDGGELNDNVQFAVWEDPDCNNVLDENENILTHGTLTENKSYAIGQLDTTPKCYGIGYCYGTWSGTSCSGALVNNDSQSDSFSADLVVNAIQKRNLYESCPVGEMLTVNLDDKTDQWVLTPGDNIDGEITYSTGGNTFYGTVKGRGLEPDSKYQITLNGPGICTSTDNLLALFTSNLFSSGYYNGVSNLESTCVNAAYKGEGVYNMNLINDWYTVITDNNGEFVYPFNISLNSGTYANVKVLVKKMLPTFGSPWVDDTYKFNSNLYEVNPISFTVN